MQVIDNIVKSMPDKEKQALFYAMSNDKKTRDHILKIIFWVYFSKDVIKDVKQKENLKAVVNKLEKKKLQKLEIEKAKQANDSVVE